MLSTVHSGALMGIEAWPIAVEVNTGECGEPTPVVVGMATTAVKESKDRVWAAIANSRYTLPIKRTTINLAPGHLRKEGALYDLPMAIGVLHATGQIQPQALEDYLVAGELSLSGELRPVKGGLALAVCALQDGKTGLLLPPKTAMEAALLTDITVYEVESMDAACAFLEGRQKLEPVINRFTSTDCTSNFNGLDFSDVKGQYTVRRAVEVAAAGGHNLLMLGPPGSGKSMISKRIPTILPPLQESEYLDILRIYSASGKTLSGESLSAARPFRSPHHTISDVGLIGGGAIPGPGEISLAHHGVLFLDELPEFKRGALEVLRQPLEDGEVTISRSAGRITLPSSFMLVSAMNPCPCGYLSDPRQTCQCSPLQVQRYRSRISGPLLDRIDIHVEAPALSIEELRQKEPGESSNSMRERVATARRRQSIRFRNNRPNIPMLNARMAHREIRSHCRLDSELGDRLQQAMKKLHLSARAYDRILKVARTVADLDDSADIRSAHLMEAINYRTLDRSHY
ncbi:YifB family Mg chelatase-like AAA ATPase [Puniceicoccales bacterium CK1056]|uniref:YifB family Mg chelatase-like AAA ATPase n=1 Tax=Oceanipulchritudo coccoides TaxID=2706888 RepID=A0A6B2LWN0_9BACT|nr:YifB family Mg chelatase-like AAA ATPase [Oceanipulchritudo coccoides]NDV60898.1 YifB family Mg chelatase-like AAA ATPase [Oceanipulchritudo coccoides]